jgi:hypothetical protein
MADVKPRKFWHCLSHFSLGWDDGGVGTGVHVEFTAECAELLYLYIYCVGQSGKSFVKNHTRKLACILETAELTIIHVFNCAPHLAWCIFVDSLRVLVNLLTLEKFGELLFTLQLFF